MNNKNEIGIYEFQGKNRFLSNFFPSPFKLMVVEKGAYDSHFMLEFVNNEQWYVYNKCKYYADRREVMKLTKPGDIKRYGRKVNLDPDFEKNKIDIMLKGVRAKFNQNPELATQLIATGSLTLQEGNKWGDMFWGINLNPKKGIVGAGKNILGHILMQVRSELVLQKEQRSIVDFEKNKNNLLSHLLPRV